MTMRIGGSRFGLRFFRPSGMGVGLGGESSGGKEIVESIVQLRLIDRV